MGWSTKINTPKYMEQTFSSSCLTLWHCLDSDHEDDSALVSPKNKCNFLKTENAIYASICYMDIAKTSVALELMHSIDCVLWTLGNLCQLTPEISKESTDEIKTVRSLRLARGRKCWETNRKITIIMEKEGNEKNDAKLWAKTPLFLNECKFSHQIVSCLLLSMRFS